MAQRRKATTRKATSKQARKTSKKGAKKAARKGGKKTTRKATKKAAKKAPKAAATGSRPKTVRFTTRKSGVFTHQDLTDHLMAWNPELGKKEARTYVEDVLNTLQTAITKTDKVRLKGIGTITKKKIPARKGGKLVKNPFTGELVKSKAKPASVRVKLSAAKELKQKA